MRRRVRRSIARPIMTRLGRLGRRLAGVFAPRGRDGFEVPPLRHELDFGAVAELADLPAAEPGRGSRAVQREIARRVLRSRLYPPRG